MADIEQFDRIYWQLGAGTPGHFETLKENVECDVLIIGAGILGLSTAWGLGNRGISTCVLEAAQIGSGASGRNGGLVVPSLPRLGPNDVMNLMGPYFGKRLVEMVAGSAQLVFNLIRHQDMQCSAVQNGWLNPVHAPSLITNMQRRAEDWQQAGGRSQWLDAPTARKRTGSDSFHGAIFDASGGHLNPLAYTRELARSARLTGARLYEHSPVTAITARPGGWQITTPNGVVTAKRILQCTNAQHPELNRHLSPTLSHSFASLKVYQLATAPVAETARATVLPGNESLSDTRNNLFACRYTADGRLVTGGMVAVTHLAAEQRLKRALAERMERIFPQLGEVRFEYIWRGTAALTPDFLPRLFSLGDGWLAPLGCNGRGIALSTSLGLRLAEYLDEGDPDRLPLPISGTRPIPLHGVMQYLPQMLLPLGILQDRYRR